MAFELSDPGLRTSKEQARFVFTPIAATQRTLFQALALSENSGQVIEADSGERRHLD